MVEPATVRRLLETIGAAAVCGLTLQMAGMGLTPLAVTAQERPRRIPVERFRLGGVEASQATAFSAEPRIAARADKSFLVYGSPETSLRLFDAAGTLIRTIGREGDGPGEFRAVTNAGFVGDTVWARDWRHWRFSLFSLDGVLLGSVPVAEPFAEHFPSREGALLLLEDGRALAAADSPPLGPEPASRRRIPVIVGDRAMESRDTLGTIMVPGNHLFVPPLVFWNASPFPHPPLMAVSSDGDELIFVDWDESVPSRIRLEKYDLHGIPTGERVLQTEVSAVPGEVRRRVVREAMRIAGGPLEDARQRGTRLPGDVEDAVTKALAIPEDYPPVQQVVLGPDGSVWLRRMEEVDQGSWWVLGPSLELLFEVELPSGSTLVEATADACWVTIVSEYDVPIVVRYDLEISSDSSRR